MPGKKGQIHRAVVRDARQKMWQSMRILRRFTIPDICRTSQATYGNTRKYVRRLCEHGILAKADNGHSGRPGMYNTYRLVLDLGPDRPSTCNVCGLSVAVPCGKGKRDE